MTTDEHELEYEPEDEIMEKKPTRKRKSSSPQEAGSAGEKLSKNWDDDAHSKILKKFPELHGKPESVVLGVWALDQNKDLTPQDWRDLSEATGVSVAGRAVGSARQIVGLAPKVEKKQRPAGEPAPRRGRPPKAAVSYEPPSSLDSVSSAFATLRDIEMQHAKMRSTLEKIGALIEETLRS